ncbi:hypothetical protein M8C21_032533 [Ambrosia artemisiifolia]|uniref:Uncharacterized protein n=1 Tax=Ambrosia artemisiifolia TaxID=4212 RepID=A0AAD5GLU0_AMBAR|nr:hypothetical protein M8C21_032533 [Ambrosia artemisiifolia]
MKCDFEPFCGDAKISKHTNKLPPQRAGIQSAQHCCLLIHSFYSQIQLVKPRESCT